MSVAVIVIYTHKLHTGLKDKYTKLKVKSNSTEYPQNTIERRKGQKSLI